MSGNTGTTRRSVLTGILALAGVAAIGGGIYEFLLNKARHYPRTAYDDLLYKLPDRESAKALGTQILATDTTFDPERTAAALRATLKDKELASALQSDIHSNAIVELRGWVLPQTLADLCALAAKVG
jgi:hypothetical protein